MNLWDKAKTIWSAASGAASAATNPVSAVAGAVGGVANAVTAVEQKADHAQMLDAGKAEGKLQDVAESEKRIATAAGAASDKRLRSEIDSTRYRD